MVLAEKYVEFRISLERVEVKLNLILASMGKDSERQKIDKFYLDQLTAEKAKVDENGEGLL